MKYHRDFSLPFVLVNVIRHSMLGEGWRTYARIGDGPYRYVKPIPEAWQLPFVADPFLFAHDGKLWLFAETLDKSGKGVLCGFEYVNGTWNPIGKVLEERFHLSYPQVFEYENHVYMIPESSDCGRGCVSLYEATSFPTGWIKRTTLIDKPFADSTIYFLNGWWYMACYTIPPDESAELWCAPNLFGPWKRHPQYMNINQSKRLRRCGGAFLNENGRLYRVAQDCNGTYGKRLFKVPVLKMTPSEYVEGSGVCFLDRNTVPKRYKHTYNQLRWEGELVEVVDVHWPYRKDIGAFFSEIAHTVVSKIKKD